MTAVISENYAFEIIDEFISELLEKEKELLALYAVGSLGGGYYRPGQSDFDTLIIVSDQARISQEAVNQIAAKYYEKYNIPKGFGAVLIREAELNPPYLRSEQEGFEFTLEIARLKTQGKLRYGNYDLEKIPMPKKEDFKKDTLIMEKWFAKEFGYPMFDQLDFTSCSNCIIRILQRYLILEKDIFEFNKLKTIATYVKNDPPLVDYKVFEIINKKLIHGILSSEEELQTIRKAAQTFRDFFNLFLLDVESRTL